MIEIADARTPEEASTHTVLVGGRDDFESEYEVDHVWQFWACEPRHVEMVEEWVRRIKHMSQLQTRYEGTLPLGIRGAVKISAVRANHIAINRVVER